MNKEYKKRKLLYSLILANSHDVGISGIPQVTRVTFKQLREMNSLQVDGMITVLSPKHTNLKKELKELDVSLLLSEILSGNAHCSQLAGKFARIKRSLCNYARMFKRNFILRDLPLDLFRDTIFKYFFSYAIESKDFNTVTSDKFVLTNFCSATAFARGSLSYLPTPILDAKGYDYVMFQSIYRVKLPKGVIGLMRYQDAIPVTHPLTVVGEYSTRYHYKVLKYLSHHPKEYKIITASNYTKDVVLSMFPQLEESVYTIYDPLVSKFYKDDDLTRDAMWSVIESYFEHRGKLKKAKKRLNILRKKRSAKFILSVSTIEPRKNWILLLESFKYLKSRYPKLMKDVSLVIVGGLGWKYDKILKSMEPLMKTGDVFYLGRIETEEINILYNTVDLFVYPSLVEGFGLPPLEAMSVGLPVISSRIPVHEEIQADAPEYIDPYDFKDLAYKIKEVLFKQRLREKLIKKGFERVKRFSDSTIKDEWQQFFEYLERQ